MMTDDMALVRDYAARQSEPAFETLVTRYVNLVYSAALRQVSQHGETKNVSSAGVLFQSEADLHIGEPVEYVIPLPTSPADGERVRLHCIGKVGRFARKAEIAATLERYEFVR